MFQAYVLTLGFGTKHLLPIVKPHFMSHKFWLITDGLDRWGSLTLATILFWREEKKVVVSALLLSSTNLSYFFLESECELWSTKTKWPLPLWDHGQPLKQKWDGDIEGKIPDYVEVWWLYEESKNMLVDKTISNYCPPLCHSFICTWGPHFSAMSNSKASPRWTASWSPLASFSS